MRTHASARARAGFGRAALAGLARLATYHCRDICRQHPQAHFPPLQLQEQKELGPGVQAWPG